MPITVFKRFVDFPKEVLPDGREVSIRKRGLGKARRVPFEIYNLEEAREKERNGEIEIVEHWREHFFKHHEDLTGKYILTDDDPPKVTPVVRCHFHQKPDRKRPSWVCVIDFPWTPMLSMRRQLLFGLRARAPGTELKKKLGRARIEYIKLFILLAALGWDQKKIVQIIWGLKSDVEQEYFVRLIVTSEQGRTAAQELARETFSEINIAPKDIAQRLITIIDDEKKTPVELRAELCQYVFGLLGIKEESESPQIAGLFSGALLPSPEEHPKVERLVGAAVARLKEGVEPEVVAALDESQGEVVPGG